MKSSVADYKTRIYCVRIEPVNSSAEIIRLAGYPVDITMSNSEVYRSDQGYEFSGVSAETGTSSGVVDLTGILGTTGISSADLESGVYDGARVYLFATSWANPIEDDEPLSKMLFGKVKQSDDRFTVELMSLVDVLNQDVGLSYSPVCQWTLFDRTLDGKVLPAHLSRCTGPRSSPDGPDIDAYKVTGSLTAATSQVQIADSSLTDDDDYWAYGEIRFTTGANANLRPIRIASYTQSGGVIVLRDPLPYSPAVSDEYEMIPGCRKRLIEDCKTKYSNAVNYGGHPSIPTGTQYTQMGRK